MKFLADFSSSLSIFERCTLALLIFLLSDCGHIPNDKETES